MISAYLLQIVLQRCGMTDCWRKISLGQLLSWPLLVRSENNLRQSTVLGMYILEPSWMYVLENLPSHAASTYKLHIHKSTDHINKSPVMARAIQVLYNAFFLEIGHPPTPS